MSVLRSVRNRHVFVVCEPWLAGAAPPPPPWPHRTVVRRSRTYSSSSSGSSRQAGTGLVIVSLLAWFLDSVRLGSESQHVYSFELSADVVL